MAQFKKKPTIKEMASVLIEINQKVNELTKVANKQGEGLNEVFGVVGQLDAVIGMYVDMNGHNEKLNAHIIKKREEAQKANDAKANGDADKPNLQGDTDGESSGTEGIREKE